MTEGFQSTTSLQASVSHLAWQEKRDVLVGRWRLPSTFPGRGLILNVPGLGTTQGRTANTSLSKKKKP